MPGKLVDDYKCIYSHHPSSAYYAPPYSMGHKAMLRFVCLSVFWFCSICYRWHASPFNTYFYHFSL